MTTPPPEIFRVDTRRVWCDGATDIRSGKLYRAAALGHPKTYFEIGSKGFVDCGYCDRRFLLTGGPADSDDIDGTVGATEPAGRPDDSPATQV